MPGNELLFNPNLRGLPVKAFLKMSLFSKTPEKEYNSRSCSDSEVHQLFVDKRWRSSWGPFLEEPIREFKKTTMVTAKFNEQNNGCARRYKSLYISLPPLRNNAK